MQHQFLVLYFKVNVTTRTRHTKEATNAYALSSMILPTTRSFTKVKSFIVHQNAKCTSRARSQKTKIVKKANKKKKKKRKNKLRHPSSFASWLVCYACWHCYCAKRFFMTMAFVSFIIWLLRLPCLFCFVLGVRMS